MNHETVFILNPVLSDVQVKETVSKFEDFLLLEEPKWYEKWGLKKKWSLKFKIRKVVLSFIRNSKYQERYCLETEFRRDENYAFLTVCLDKLFRGEERRNKIKISKA
jgi:small subunit ribosomal protein S6